MRFTFRKENTLGKYFFFTQWLTQQLHRSGHPKTNRRDSRFFLQRDSINIYLNKLCCKRNCLKKKVQLRCALGELRVRNDTSSAHYALLYHEETPPTAVRRVCVFVCVFIQVCEQSVKEASVVTQWKAILLSPTSVSLGCVQEQWDI